MTQPLDTPADAPGAPDRRDAGPVDDTEAQQKAEGLTVPEGVAQAYEEQIERGAAARGEGQAP